MIILPAGFELPNNPLIGYDNLVTAAGLSADQESSSAPVTQLANPATYNPWSGTSAVAQSVVVALEASAPVDYVGIAQHNLGTAGIVYHIEYSADGSSWTEVDSDLPADDGVIIHVFDSVTSGFWRLRFEAGSEPPSMAVLYVGSILQVPRRVYVGHTPITLGRSTDIRSGRSESGQFLGRVVKRRLFECSVQFENLEPDWYRSNFDPFALDAEENPFFWAWRPTSYPYEVAYAWAMRNIVPDNQRPNGMMRVSFPIQALTGTLAALGSFSSS